MRIPRYLIVNADDFGQSYGINRGIMAAYKHGIVTSASLMVRWPAAAEAAAYGRHHPDLSLGLHVDVSEWAYRAGQWSRLYEVIPLADLAAVAAEVFRQLEAFVRLVGRKPTHLDSHQHSHCYGPLRMVLRRLAQRLEIPLRHYCEGVHYCGDFYGQTAKGTPMPEVISVEGLLNILVRLPSGVTELSCHPGQEADLETMYRTERAEEVKVLCDPRVRASLSAMGIELCSFRDCPAAFRRRGNGVRGAQSRESMAGHSGPQTVDR